MLAGLPGTDQFDPSWSRANGRIVFASARGLYTIRADGTDPRNLVACAALNCVNGPRWSPDGGQIVFVRDVAVVGEGYRPTLWVLDVATGQLRPLVGPDTGRSGATGPSW
jgi:Tol biopolymer transport system component